LIAAIYAVLGLAFLPISFGVYQVRIAEALAVLPFLTPAAIPGLFIGCMLANVFGGLGFQDIVFGSLITLAAASLTRLVYHMGRSRLSSILATLPVFLLWLGALFILSQDAVHWPVIILAVASIPIIILAARLSVSDMSSRLVITIVRILSLALVVLSIYFAVRPTEAIVMIIGAVALVAAWWITWLLAVIWFSKGNPNVLVAPLPPVLLNAFGVSLYLAPIMGVSYWFSVQMVGVGQLIACYLLGLPLLRLLQNRKSFFV
jgi:uncharacterized membrane protein